MFTTSLLIAAALEIAAPPPAGFDRADVAARTLAHLQDLIRIDTTNPPGNEAACAAWIAERLADLDGVEVSVLEAAEGRANLVARLRAESPAGRPVLVMGHMDVVGAQAGNWSTPPLEPTLRDGRLYGRGAIDDKGMLAALLAILPDLAARRAELSRDVVLLATAGEEGGPPVGIDWVLEHHRDLLGDPAFALNEGGRIRLEDGAVRTVNVQTTEKVPYNVRVTARGPSGHGSVPLPDNALAALARACQRLHAWRPPTRLSPTVRAYFGGLARVEPDPVARAAMRTVAMRPRSDDAARAAARLSEEPLHNAVLRSGLSLTQIEGGIRSNVIPSEGWANVNVRVLPEEDVREIVAAMAAVVDDPAVTVELVGEPRAAPPPSPTDGDLYRALEAAALAMAPDAVVLPFLSTGATDGAALRAAGIPTYGILPMPLAREDELRMHGDDERVPVESLGWAAEFLYRVLAEVALP